MKEQINNTVRIAALVLAITLPLTQAAYAAEIPFVVDPQADAASQAAAQAVANQQMVNQQVMQQTQQANQTAQQMQQQAVQNAQTATDGQYSSSSRSTLPSHVPGPIPLPTGPIPTEISAAHKVFLTNAGAAHNFPVDENTAYNAVRDAMVQWGHYELVDSPQEAEIIFSLQDLAPLTGIEGDINATYSVSSPTFLLNITDAKTNAPLWTITSPVYVWGSKSSQQKRFTLAAGNLVSRVKVIAGEPLTAQETTNLNTYPHSHALLIGLIVGGAVVIGGAVAGAETLNHMKSNADTFCQAHDITPCPGG